MKGPERFFYDTSSYTGTAKNGGPSTRRRDSSCVDFTSYLNRGAVADKRGVKMPENPKPTNARERSEHKLKQMQSSTKSWAMTGTADLLKPAPSLASSESLLKIKLARSTSSHQLTRKGSSRAGPARLFYDKSSWTGTARRTESSAGNSDASSLFDRSASDVRGVKIEQKQKRGPKTAEEKLEELRNGSRGWSVTGLAKGLLNPLPTLDTSERAKTAKTPETKQRKKGKFSWSMKNKAFSKSVGCLPDAIAVEDEEDGANNHPHLIAPPPLDSSSDDSMRTSSTDDSIRSGVSTTKGSERGSNAGEDAQEMQGAAQKHVLSEDKVSAALSLGQPLVRVTSLKASAGK